MRGALSDRAFKNATTRYAAAFLATTIALLLRLALSPVLGDYLPFIALFAAVAFSAWYCGTKASILAVVVAIIGARYWFIHPLHAFSIPDAAQSLGMFVFVFASSIIIAFGERNHRSSERIRITREELEAQVSQRTTELNIANQQLRELTSHVLHLQDEERRRIARELHDSAGQSLVVLAMNLTRLETEAKAQMASLTKTLATVADSAVLVNELSMGIRTISYLLHPPMLDEAGLGPAMRWYIQGFAERSKIVVDLDLSDDFGRLSQDLETTIFRVVQECLANILRHSESRVANVSIERSAEEVRIEVRDKGKGIAPGKLSEIAVSHTPGVGIRGMQERVRQLGGTLKITSDGADKGTLVVALFPFAAPTSVVQDAPGEPSLVGERLPGVEGLLLPVQNGAQQEGSDYQRSD